MSANQFSCFSRPKVNVDGIDFKSDLFFQQIDVELYNEKDVKGENLVVFVFFGVMDNQTSVAVHVHGYRPYLYIPLSSDIYAEKIAYYQELINVWH